MEEEIKEAKSAGAIIKEILKNLKGIKLLCAGSLAW